MTDTKLPGSRHPGAKAPPARSTSTRRDAGASAQERFAARATSVRRRPWRLALWSLAAVVVVAATVWAIWFSPLLAVRDVTVTGLADAGEQQAVLQAAAVPRGTPLARVDVAGASARVATIATVESVAVSRSWPGTVVVTVQRKTPVLAVRNPQGQLQVVDAQGATYEVVGTVPAGVPLVDTTSSTPDPQGLRAAIGVLALLPANQRTSVSRVTVTSADLVTFQLANPAATGKGPATVTVVWGGSAAPAKKLAVLSALLPTAPAVIDVSAPDTPVTR